VFFGNGIRLFERIATDRLGLRLVSTVPSPLVTHVTYSVEQKRASV